MLTSVAADTVPTVFVTANGIRIYVERAGSGPNLLIISGTGGDLRRRPSPLDWPLINAFSLIAYDQRGLGQSDQPGGPYTMAGYADDAAAVLDALDVERAHVLGVSFGGMVAQELAIRHPARVDRLVLACTSGGGDGGSSFPLHELTSLDEDARMARQMELTDTRWSPGWQASNPERAAKIRETFRRPAPDAGALRQLEARRHHDTWDRLEFVAAPTLVCAGRYDAIAPMANAEALAGRIPGARLEVFEGGHLFLAQDPAAFPAVVTFLQSS